jgi:hypothetical protein
VNHHHEGSVARVPYTLTSDDRTPERSPVRTTRSGQATRQVDPTQIAAYRWLLRRLFANDLTPPPIEERKAA